MDFDNGTPVATDATTTENIGKLIEQMKVVLADLDKAEAVVESLSKVKTALRMKLMDAMKRAGQDSDGAKVAADGLTVTWRDKTRVDYDPAQYESIQRWAVENGYGGIFYRQFSARKVEDLAEAGVVLPPGLALQTYHDLDVRRTK